MATRPLSVVSEIEDGVYTGEDFADSAEKADLAYKDLLQELLHVGLRWRPAQAA